jgi:DNA-binding transcriptional ArsR family regulator
MSANSPTEIDAVADALNATFAALSDPTRRAMLARLSQGEASVNELAAPFKMSLPAVSKHIKVLEKAGLLTKTISAQQRPCKIDSVQLTQAVDWIDQFTTKTIAKEAINTPATSKNKPKKQVKSEKPSENMPKKPKFKLKVSKTDLQSTLQNKEKTHDNNDPNDLQQQIGFDF